MSDVYAETTETLRCLLLPALGATLLVPQTAVAEVVPYAEPEPVDGAPPWLLGWGTWRGCAVPVVDFRALQWGTAAEPPVPDARLAVFNVIRAGSPVDFYAVRLQGLPRLVRADASIVSAAGPETGAMVAAAVTVADEPALIPDLDAVEAALEVL